MQRSAALTVAALLVLATLTPAVPVSAGTTHPTYPLGSAKRCRAHYVERTLTHKVNGKTKSYIACVYSAREPSKTPTGQPTTTLPATTTTTLAPTTTTAPGVPTTTTVSPQYLPSSSTTGSLTVYSVTTPFPVGGQFSIDMIDLSSGATLGTWTTTGLSSAQVARSGLQIEWSVTIGSSATLSLDTTPINGVIWTGPSSVVASAADFTNRGVAVQSGFDGSPGWSASESSKITIG